MEKQDYSKTIKIVLFGVAIAVLLLALGFQFWIIRSQGYEITTLRNEIISNRADAEDMQRKQIDIKTSVESQQEKQGINLESDLLQSYRKEFESFTKMFEGENSLFPTSPEFLKSFFDKKSATVIYADEMMVSYRLDFDSYSGGAHGVPYVCTGTIARFPSAIRDSSHLRLADIVNEEQLPRMKQLILDAFQKEKAIRDENAVKAADASDPPGGKHYWDEPEPTENFYYDEKGLHFFYNEYEIDCFAAGPYDLCIDWPLPSLVTGAFTPAGGTDEDEQPKTEAAAADSDQVGHVF